MAGPWEKYEPTAADGPWAKYQPKGEPDAISTAINRSGMATALDTGLALASGAVAAPVAGLAGLATTAFKGPDAGADVVRNVQDKLTYEPRTAGGQGLVKAVSYPFQKLGEAADTAGERVTDATGSPLVGAGVNTALQSVPLVLGRVAPVGEGATAVAKRKAVQQSSAQYDAGTAAAKEAGYTLPPTQANPSLLNKVLEGVAGKVKTAQTASLKNQDVTNGLIRKSLGIADDAPLTVESLQGARKEAGAAYERVRSAGNVVADSDYTKALDSLSEPYLRAAKDFPKAAQTEVMNAIEAARVPSFDASSAVDQISILRKDADKAYRSGDSKLGGTYKGIANALEAQLSRHLEKSGAAPEVISDFQNARRTIAQTYTVEKYLKEDGNVDAAGLARELKRKPLTGGIKTVAEFGDQFPKAAQKPERVGGVNAISPLDVGAGGIMSAVLHNPSYLALLAARPLARSAILSKLYQDNFVNPPSYGQSAMTRLQTILGDSQRNPLLPITEIAEGQRN